MMEPTIYVREMEYAFMVFREYLIIFQRIILDTNLEIERFE